MSKAPEAPDPAQVAASQTQSNKDTAAYQAALNAKLGNVSNAYGTNTVQTDRQGLPIGQTSTLSAPLQGLFDQRTGLGSQIGGLQSQLTGLLPMGGINQDFTQAANKAQQSAYDAQAGLLQPQFDLQRKQTNQQLDDRGLPIGSEARNDATTNLNDSQSRILASLANSSYGAGLQAQNQGFNQAVTNQNLPYQQLGALTAANPSASLLAAAPGAANLQPSSVAPTNVGQIYQNSYQDQLAANNANNSQLYGGLLGIGSLALSGGTAGFGGSALAAALPLLSDRRAKTDIERIGKLNDGTPLYRFRYKGKPELHIGVMAQDIEKTQPDAVVEINGWKAVDYDKVTRRAADFKRAA